MVDESVANHAFSSRRLVMPGLEEAGAAGDAIRRTAAATIDESKRREFHSLSVVLGSSFTHSPLLLQQQAALAASGGAGDYIPSVRPGCLAPHFWLAPGRAIGASLFDHFATSGFTLLVTTAAAQAAAQDIVRSAAELGVPLKLLVQPDARLHTLYGCDLALIRPDQYVAWSGNSAADACDALAAAAGKSLEPVT